MKFIFKATEPDILNHFHGIGQCLSYCGYDVIQWKNKSAFDMFDEINPDIVIVDDLNYPEKQIRENPHVKVIVNTDNRPFDKFADLTTSTKIDIDKPHSFFLPKACNQFNYIQSKPNVMFDCDLLYIGKTHPIINKICSIQNKLNIKIFGESNGTEYYCGYINQSFIGDAFATANILLHLHETECSQQLFEALYCGASVISDRSNTTNHLFPELNYLPKEDFIISTIYKEKLSNDFKDFSGYVKENHTYFNRCIDIFDKLNLNTEDIKNGQIKFNKYLESYDRN